MAVVDLLDEFNNCLCSSLNLLLVLLVLVIVPNFEETFEDTNLFLCWLDAHLDSFALDLVQDGTSRVALKDIDVRENSLREQALHVLQLRAEVLTVVLFGYTTLPSENLGLSLVFTHLLVIFVGVVLHQLLRDHLVVESNAHIDCLGWFVLLVVDLEVGIFLVLGDQDVSALVLTTQLLEQRVISLPLQLELFIEFHIQFSLLLHQLSLERLETRVGDLILFLVKLLSDRLCTLLSVKFYLEHPDLLS